jgi:hypothetical protein
MRRTPCFLQVGDVVGTSLGSFALRFRAKRPAVQPGIEIRHPKNVGPVVRNINSISVAPGSMVLGTESR